MTDPNYSKEALQALLRTAVLQLETMMNHEEGRYRSLGLVTGILEHVGTRVVQIDPLLWAKYRLEGHDVATSVSEIFALDRLGNVVWVEPYYSTGDRLLKLGPRVRASMMEANGGRWLNVSTISLSAFSSCAAFRCTQLRTFANVDTAIGMEIALVNPSVVLPWVIQAGGLILSMSV